MTGDQPMWRKSSYSGSSGCVEAAPMPNATGIRDSKYVPGGELRVSRTTWHAFIREIAES